MVLPKRSHFKFFIGFVLLALIIPIIIFGCSGGPDQVNMPDGETGGVKPAEEQIFGELPLPVIMLDHEPVEITDQVPLQMAIRPEHAHSIQIHFKQKLDLTSAEDSIEVLPPAKFNLSWREGDVVDWTAADIRLQDPLPGESVKVRVKPGIRSKDGSMLMEELHFSVNFVEESRVRISLAGPGFQTGSVTKITSDNTFSGLFRPGLAKLRLEFTHEVDPQLVWTTIRKQLASGQHALSFEEPAWDQANRNMTVNIQQQTVSSNPLNTKVPLILDFSDLTDSRGLRLSNENARLEWAVVPAGRIFRTPGLPAGDEPAGTIAVDGDLQPASDYGFWGNRFLTWRLIGESGDYNNYALLLWDLTAGNYERLGGVFSGSYLGADWQGPTRILAATTRQVLRFQADGDFKGVSRPEEILYESAENRVIIGMDVAPNGQMAIFEADIPHAPREHDGAVDLIILTEEGDVWQRFEGVADLATSDGFWLPVRADWSDDSTSMAFVRYKFGPERSSEGYPLSVTKSLAIWQAGQNHVSDILDGIGEEISWRPGTSQVLVMLDGKWRLVMVEDQVKTGEPLNIPEGVKDFFWSPDGRYLAWRTWRNGEDSGVLDLTGGEKIQGHGIIPLGWNRDNGNFYWFRGD